MFGFHEVKWTGEHDLARFLRRHGAIDTWTKAGNSNQWHDKDGTVVAVCFYGGPQGFVSALWIKDGLRFP